MRCGMFVMLKKNYTELVKWLLFLWISHHLRKMLRILKNAAHSLGSIYLLYFVYVLQMYFKNFLWLFAEV